MKYKTTKKSMKENYFRIISIGYCGAQYLLKYSDPVAFSSGSNGWNCDYYDINGVLISTGYSPVLAENTFSTYDIVKRYNKLAEGIVHSGARWEVQRDKIAAVLNDFIKEVI